MEILSNFALDRHCQDNDCSKGTSLSLCLEDGGIIRGYPCFRLGAL